MPSYKRPGVYFEEAVSQAEAITGANLSAAAFLAGNPRGPVTPKLITSWSQYLTHFGGFGAGTDYLPYSVFGYFSNGGREAYIQRVAGAGAAAALKNLLDRAVPANEVQNVAITGTPTGGTFTLTFNGQTTAGIVYNAAAAAVQTALEALSNIDPGDITVTGGALPGIAVVVTFIGPKGNTNQPQMTATPSLTGGTTPAVVATTTTEGAGPINTLRISAANPGVWANTLYYDILDSGTDRFTIVVKLGGTTDANIVERWVDLSMVSSDARYPPSLINSGSSGSPYITVTDLASPTTGVNDRPALQANVALAGGLDGAAVAASDLATALSQLDSVERPLNLNLPGHSGTAVGSALTYALNRGDVFVVADPPVGATPDNTPVTGILSVATGFGSSSYGAVYYPWIQAADPASASPGAVRVLPPGGAVIGQYAATDTTRGVFKTPAGINNRIAGAVGVERRLTGTELDNLNAANVNVIRQIPGAGIVVMGGRTLKLTGADKYVAARRTLIYIRSSLLDSTRFAIFEPNDERLWLVMRAIIERFLIDFWVRGGLRGNSAGEAFYVKCDDELNTPQSIAAGEVKIEIGVALQYPAEFVVFRLSQREVGATVTIAA